MAGHVRIISGRWRGRKLPVPPVTGLRPTPDRVRETVFNWLGPRVAGARCLDLYAGSGSLGLEAASRGAARVTLVERDRTLARSLADQVERLDADRVEVVRADVERWLLGPATQYDVVLLDPPFAAAPYARLARQLDAGWLAPDALVYIESALDFADLDLPAGWSMLRSNKAGQVRYHLACVSHGSTSGAPRTSSIPDERS